MSAFRSGRESSDGSQRRRVSFGKVMRMWGGRVDGSGESVSDWEGVSVEVESARAGCCSPGLIKSMLFAVVVLKE